jgi:2-polyprenyl-3-methyl-5-hydroxy-6-metoxy-1,4-benzoquinol methylase
MTTNWVAHWDERYGGPEFVYGTGPNEYLRSQAHRLAIGERVLAAADGEGRNGVWLAEQGLRVTSVDQSRVAQEKAARLAREREVRVDFVRADLAEWSAAAGEYDAVVAIFAHFPAAVRPRIHRALARALRPGGVLILEAFHVRQLGAPSGGPRDASMLYTAEMLREDFAELTTIELLEGTALLSEGAKHQGLGTVVRFVGARPAP